MVVYTCTARRLGSQSAAALSCLTQKVEHFVMFQVLYIPFLWGIFLRLGSTSSCCVVLSRLFTNSRFTLYSYLFLGHDLVHEFHRTAIKGRLKTQKRRSDSAKDNKKGVVECRRKLVFLNNTIMVKILPKQPKTEQMTALQAAIWEFCSSMITSVKSA